VAEDLQKGKLLLQLQNKNTIGSMINGQILALSKLRPSLVDGRNIARWVLAGRGRGGVAQCALHVNHVEPAAELDANANGVPDGPVACCCVKSQSAFIPAIAYGSHDLPVT
jgi:hypothetical protein